ncbi:DUF3181 family protein [Okeania sp. SIO1H2]|uniref:DUF3181 family protein n=1 Tax=Okeania sp. SIO1H2 TaxID=2607775 RepID=UPI00141C7833|nr:DUF3181 family protein [Okeania sp. SIO1H2]NET97633.1 DUF3181 family protein [Okeania sp. SIO1H2]
MAYPGAAAVIEALAADIGDTVYIDVAKWHLYLRDTAFHTILAERFYAMVTDSDLSETGVVEILQDITVKLGGGRRSLPLSDLVPIQCQVDLLDILERHRSEM